MAYLCTLPIYIVSKSCNSKLININLKLRDQLAIQTDICTFPPTLMVIQNLYIFYRYVRHLSLR